ncbi:MAG: NAD(P)/FAD-dependent oxidoreductase [Candidatus Thiodiazotropha sp. (ex Lucina aurantia)]|uniref:Sulfide dehydrogenase [flavocytochrome c] flavoprotein chain n=2 Tax=Candidatus Thiodiazotropha TaxID=1913444 RepID=A0A7Z0VM61_9GAMM|nr:FAD/NAD(P)-binding oxidoreductase [Candidatus Thiodiazotropha endolucinida]MBT3011583.1 NAD(P)/FAD-dependent oxidoreductase [Candidatus Thiodiazotropha sp. (ex Lucina pensylvanica)]MBT3016341.1 NAD(P)/FAD-dependent oxidoreductase [Candidatus Thiodiazotropha taylori]MBT3039840.1 NAD(P)/FAD-dependent oxidoreductase [Candidatus Thiodiazotropha sp. (ex Codakia orbicularis)]MBV2103957.1 NAD(P)/FAD-dependent oxidoreductase [Candidatus Thiodiazotropha sp. (ex Lucina aurantia)]MBT3023959.1 NAD(P)/F
MRILVVGGGCGGTILANNLARRLASEIRNRKVRLTLLSASDKHMYQPGLLYVAFGQMMPDELYRDQESLLEPSIEFYVDPVEAFHLDQNKVTTKSGKTHEYDVMVIATGSRIVPEEVPGLVEGSETFYSEEAAVKMFKRLREFEGGKVAIVVGVPHKCPIAPVEVTFSLHDYFKMRGIRDKVHIKYHYPIGRIHTIENVAKWAKPEFDRIGVEYETLFNVKEVDVENQVVKSEEGTETAYDLLISIPPHRGMPVIERDKMGDGGWIPTDRYKLTMEGYDNVYVLGDTTNLPVSKTGSAAHFEAEVVAENIASIIKIGTPVRDYDGKVYCFIEAGHDRATYAMFNYENPPDLKAPNKSMHWFKMSYNKMYWTSVRGLL